MAVSPSWQFDGHWLVVGGQSTPSPAAIETAYGATHTCTDILNGLVPPPEAYNEVIQALIQVEKVAIRWATSQLCILHSLPCSDPKS